MPLSDDGTILRYGSREECVKYGKANIPSSVKRIESGAFQMAVTLCEVTIPPGVCVASNAFTYCVEIKYLEIGEGATLESYAFFHATQLEMLKIGKNVEIAEEAFSPRGDKLRHVLIDAEDESDFNLILKSLPESYKEKALPLSLGEQICKLEKEAEKSVSLKLNLDLYKRGGEYAHVIGGLRKNMNNIQIKSPFTQAAIPAYQQVLDACVDTIIKAHQEMLIYKDFLAQRLTEVKELRKEKITEVNELLKTNQDHAKINKVNQELEHYAATVVLIKKLQYLENTDIRNHDRLIYTEKELSVLEKDPLFLENMPASKRNTIIKEGRFELKKREAQMEEIKTKVQLKFNPIVDYSNGNLSTNTYSFFNEGLTSARKKLAEGFIQEYTEKHDAYCRDPDSEKPYYCDLFSHDELDSLKSLVEKALKQNRKISEEHSTAADNDCLNARLNDLYTALLDRDNLMPARRH